METAGARERIDPRARTILVIGTLATLVARLAISVRMAGIVASPDEPGFLGDAWFLGGRPHAPMMPFSPVYKIGYPLLLAPIAAFTRTPGPLQEGAIVFNALCLAAMVPAVWAILGRLGPATRQVQAWIALAACALPAVAVAVPLVRPDALLMLLVALAVLALWALVTPGRWWGRIWFGPAVAWLWVSHNRFLPLLVLSGALLVLRALFPSKEQRRWLDVANLGGLVVFAAVGTLVNRWVVDARWVAQAPSSLQGLRWSDIGDVTRELLGQWWYLIASTYGLAAFGFVVLARDAVAAARRGRALWTEPKALAALFLVLATVGTQVAAAVQLRRPVSFDLLANGRYQDVITPLLVAVGLAHLLWWAALHRDRRPWLAVGGVLLLGTFLVAPMSKHRHVLIEPAAISGIDWAVLRTADAPVVGPCVAALLAMFLLWAVGRYRAQFVVFVVLVTFTANGLFETERVVVHSRGDIKEVPLAGYVRSLGVTSVAIDTGGDRIVRATDVYWRLAGLRTHDNSQGPGDAQVLLTGVQSSLAPPGSRLIAVASDGRTAAWSLPGPEQAVLARRGLLYPLGDGTVPATSRRARIALAAPKVTVTHGSAGLYVRVTNESDVIWPGELSLPAHPVVVSAVGTGGRDEVELPELKPHRTVLVHLELAALAPPTAPTTIVRIVVRQGAGAPFTTIGRLAIVDVRRK